MFCILDSLFLDFFSYVAELNFHKQVQHGMQPNSVHPSDQAPKQTLKFCLPGIAQASHTVTVTGKDNLNMSPQGSILAYVLIMIYYDLFRL